MKIAYCGLRCSLCPIYIATITDNQDMRERFAKEWSRDNYQLTAEDITCLGCKGDCNTVFKFCRGCEIRLCVNSKKLMNCAECENYPCVYLDKSFKDDPENKLRLDEIHNNLFR